MIPQPFDHPKAPGVRTLWMLKFNSNPTDKIPSVDLFLPSPFGKNEWISTNAKDREKAQTMLSNIQKSCDALKKECQEAQKLDNIEQQLSKSEEIFKDIKNLDDMMRHFNDFMKRFYRNKSDDEKPKQ